MTFKRICNECGKELKAGFVIDGGTEYYCCEKCLYKHYTEEQYIKMYYNGDGESYYTEFYDD